MPTYRNIPPDKAEHQTLGPTRRSSPRLNTYDYTQPSTYFVTARTNDGVCLFGEVRNGFVRLNDAGRIVSDCWANIPTVYPNVLLDAFIVMPNHVHDVLLTADAQPEGGRIDLPRIMSGFKSVSARLINELHGVPGRQVWQRSFYDQIIRNDVDLDRVRAYIEANPFRWQENDAGSSVLASEDSPDASGIYMAAAAAGQVGALSLRGEGGAPALTVYTVGHSNQTMDDLLNLLRQHGIEVLADVRSAPYSRYASQFNQRALQAAVREAGLQYVFLGQELGGRPADEGLYDAEGHVDYRRVSATELFRAGIERVRRGAGQYRVALMCSEEDPTDCHRRLLVGRVLRAEGVELRHIRGDGRLDREEDLSETPLDQPHQPSLFGTPVQEVPWRSTRSVLPRSPRGSSSSS